MGVNKDMDLFETVRDKLGCEYISDMRSCRALLADAKKVVASLDLEAYTARELADMAEYLYGKKMYGADKDVIKTGTIRKAYGELIPIGFPCY
mgnify:FL=1